VSFSLGSVFEAAECIQVYYTALYRPHGSTDITSKTMHQITLCIMCNALYILLANQQSRSLNAALSGPWHHPRHCAACVLSNILSTTPYNDPYKHDLVSDGLALNKLPEPCLILFLHLVLIDIYGKVKKLLSWQPCCCYSNVYTSLTGVVQSTGV